MAEIEADGHHCPFCGEPHPHYWEGMCEQCWNEKQDADERADNGRNTGGKSYPLRGEHGRKEG